MKKILHLVDIHIFVALASDIVLSQQYCNLNNWYCWAGALTLLSVASNQLI